MTENLKNSPDFDIMSLQSEFTADEMGKITAILAKNREIDINRSVADDYINTLLRYREEKNENKAAAEMSDDDLRSFAQQLRNKK